LFLEAFNGVCRGMAVANSLQGSLDFHQNCRNRRGGSRFFPFRRAGTSRRSRRSFPDNERRGDRRMGRGLLLWMVGIPLPIILLIWLFGGLS
jgi:hypothetical protein